MVQKKQIKKILPSREELQGPLHFDEVKEFEGNQPLVTGGGDGSGLGLGLGLGLGIIEERGLGLGLGLGFDFGGDVEEEVIEKRTVGDQ